MGKGNDNKKQVYSRNIQHGNTLNKRGVVADFQKSMKNKRVQVDKGGKKARVPLDQAVMKEITHEFGDVIVKGRTTSMDSSDSMDVEGSRFTIPDSPNNKNVFEQAARRASIAKSLAAAQVRMRAQSNPSDYEEDTEHDIKLLD